MWRVGRDGAGWLPGTLSRYFLTAGKKRGSIVRVNGQIPSRDVLAQGVFHDLLESVDHALWCPRIAGSSRASAVSAFCSCVVSYPSQCMSGPQAFSRRATASAGSPDCQLPALLVRTKGMSWRVFLVEDH